jgi:3-oxoacyl-[acyl-carrier-protein] synthase III
MATFSRITGLGYYVPDNVVTNDDLTKLMDTSDAWIRERTGIGQRRYFTHGKDTNASMATAASRMALDRAGLQPADVDLIVYATITPDYYFPGSAFLMQRELGIESIGVIDLRQQCSGFVYALSIADQFIRGGMYKTVLVVGSEIQSTYLNKSTEGRNVAVIFGDGAGAAVLQATQDPDHRILSTHLHADGRYAEELMVKEPVRFTEVINEALEANNVTAADLDLLVPHQANIRISDYVRQQMNLPEEKVVSNIDRYGNTTAASIPIALTEAYDEGRIKPGDLVCLAAFGSGFTWASALVRW